MTTHELARQLLAIPEVTAERDALKVEIEALRKGLRACRDWLVTVPDSRRPRSSIVALVDRLLEPKDQVGL